MFIFKSFCHVWGGVGIYLSLLVEGGAMLRLKRKKAIDHSGRIHGLCVHKDTDSIHGISTQGRGVQFNSL